MTSRLTARAWLSASTAGCVLAQALGILAGCTPGPLRNLQRGCDQGSPAACLELGIAYYEGKAPEGQRLVLDYAQARRAFARSCEKNEAAACYDLGHMYEKGEGGGASGLRSVEYFKKSCELGDALGCGRAAVAYRDGLFVSRDLALATRLAKKGCEKENQEGCALYKKLAVTAGSGGASGITAEVTELSEGCDGGSGDACFELGVRFDEGNGVKQDKGKAVLAYRAACDKEDLRGCHNLGVMLIDGEGVPRAAAPGFKLLGQSCEKGQRRSCEVLFGKLNKYCQGGSAEACTVVGRLLYKGEMGLPQDPQKGIDYLRRGCKSGDKEACEDLRRIGLDP